MPKFIGNTIDGATRIENNAAPTKDRMKLTYIQARKMPPNQVMCSLNTTDKGSKGVLAKRWFRWFANPNDVRNNPNSSILMLFRSNQILGNQV